MRATREKAAQEVTEVSEMAEIGSESLPLRLAFMMSARSPVLRIIRFSNQEASFLSLVLGFFLSVLGSLMTTSL
jgi:hypothetical protein